MTCRVSSGWIGVALLATLGCEQPDLPDDIVVRSTHFELYHRAGVVLCPGLLDAMEAHLRGVQRELGLAEPRRRLRVYRYSDASDYERHTPCPQHRGGCAEPGAAYTVSATGHELVHLYMLELVNRRVHPFLMEGIAEVYRGDCGGPVPPNPRLPLQEALRLADNYGRNSPEQSSRLYDASRYFVSHLLATYGPTRFVELYRSTGFAGSDLTRSTLTVLGARLEELWEAANAPLPWFASPSRCPCGGPTLVFDQEVPLGTGCRTGFDHQVFELAAGESLVTRVRWVANGEGGAPRLMVGSCAGRSVAPGPLLTGGPFLEQVTGVSSLPAGRYYVALAQGSGTATFSRRAWMAPTCSAVLPAERLEPGSKLSVQVAPPAGGVFAVDVASSGPAAQLTVGGERAWVSACTGCPGPDQTCAPVQGALTLAPGRHIIHMSPLGEADGRGLDILLPGAITAAAPEPPR